MSGQEKEIIASKGQLAFYKRCYARFGYEAEVEYRNKNHLHYTLLLRRNHPLSAVQKERLRMMEEKLRIIEVIDQKKRRFFSLFFNLFFHAAAFCIQGLLLSWLGLYESHPAVMLRAGVVILQVILVTAFICKLWECFKWNTTQKRLKAEILSAETEKLPEMPEEQTSYYISVLFTRGPGFSSDLLYWLTGRQYTHASVGLDKQTECFYSFNFRGFREEHPSHRRLQNGKKDSLCYQFRVSQEDYQKLQKTIQNYLEEKESYHYSYIGALLCILHIYLPWKQQKHYFCSEFVSEQIRQMESFKLKRAPGMYLPGNLAKALGQQKNLYRVLVNEV